MQVQKVIEELGYTAKEAKVYLAALALGESTVSDIAEKVKLPRTSVQLIVDKLHEEGLLIFYVQKRYRYWVAENPKQLLENLRKREEAVHSALPALSAMQSAGRKKGRVRKGHIDAPLQRLADTSPSPVLIVNERGEIVYVNEPWITQFGYSLEEVVGENPRILKSGKTPRDTYDRMWRVLRMGKIFQTDELVDKRKDGSHVRVTSTIFPIRHNGSTWYVQILNAEE